MKNIHLEKRLKIARYVSDELQKIDNVKMVAITGSCAIGCPTEKSDIDFQIAFNELPENTEIDLIKNCLISKYGNCKQNKYFSMGTVFGLTIENIDMSMFYGKVDDFKSVVLCGNKMGTEGESSLSVYYDMLPLYDSLNICGYIRDNIKYTNEKQKEILSNKLSNLKDLFNHDFLKISENKIMFLKYKYEIIDNIIEIVYALNKRPKRMLDDFIYMSDKLSFYPQYLSSELLNITSQNNTDIFNKQAKSVIVKIFDDSCNEILKANSKIFIN